MTNISILKTNYDIGTNTVKTLLSCKVLFFVSLWNTGITLIFMPDLFSALYENISITPSNLPVKQPSIVNRLNTSSLSQRKPSPSRTPTNARNSCKKRLRKKCTIINIVHVLTKTWWMNYILFVKSSWMKQNLPHEYTHISSHQPSFWLNHLWGYLSRSW